MQKIIFHLYRIFLTTFCVVAASVHAQTIEQSAKNPRQLKTFTFVPATAPSVYSFKSSWRAPRDNSSNLPKSQDELNAIRLTQMDLFDDAMRALKPKLEEELNQAFLRHWRDLGFEVKPIENLKRRLRQPDVLNFSSIKTDADAIVQVVLSEVGLFRPSDGSAYYPYVYVNAVVHVPKSDESLYPATATFGVEANKKEVELYLAPDPKNGYVGFVEVASNIKEVDDRLRKALAIAAKRIASLTEAAMDKPLPKKKQ
jgi:hypothetical protein